MIALPDEFLNFLASEEMRAQDTALDHARAAALRAYQGDSYGDEEDGRSQAVTRDVSEVIDFMAVGILGTIMAGGKAVAFETEPEQVPMIGLDGQPQSDPQTQQPVMQKVDYGEQATAAVQYQFLRKQPGYRILHDVLKAGLLEKTGIVKTYVERKAPRTSVAELPETAIDLSSGSPSVAGMTVTEADPIAPHPDPSQSMWRVRHQLPAPPPVVRDEVVPNEWFLVSPDTVDLEESPYVGQKTPKSLSQLVEMGYERAELESVWSNAPPDTVVTRARDSDRSTNRDTPGLRGGVERQLWLTEEYPLYDLDGDGVAERLFIHRIGREVLAVMEVEEQPYSGWSPVPMQHRFTGQSIADKTMDIQRIRSVLLRQALDSLYQSNSPRMLLPDECQTADTIDDLLTVRPGALVRYKGVQAPTPLTMVDTSPTAFQAMEMMSSERESRTGVTRQSQGLNPDTLNKTASGMAMLQANSQQIELYVTRNFAEMIVAPMFAKRYRLMREHVPPFRMKIDGQYVTVDPSKWPEEPDMAINVGLGTGSKDQRMGFRQQLLTAQQMAMGGGLQSVTEVELYNNMAAMIEDAGLGIPTDYWKDPSTIPPAPPRPDPHAAEAQNKLLMTQQAQEQAHQQAMTKLQLQQEQQQADAANKAQAAAADIQTKREHAAMTVQLEGEKAAVRARLEQQTADREDALAHRRLTLEYDLKAKMAAAKVPTGGDDLPGFRAGGSIDA